MRPEVATPRARAAPLLSDRTVESGKDGGLRGVLAALRSWRTASVVLLSFSSGLPLGLVWIAIPDWMRSIGVDIRVVGMLTLAQAPWSLKVLWSPCSTATPRRGSARGAAGWR